MEAYCFLILQCPNLLETERQNNCIKIKVNFQNIFCENLLKVVVEPEVEVVNQCNGVTQKSKQAKYKLADKI